ncbi:hypothetical protein B0A50_01494 [Salinomyces thailandicus]|uniref:Uncharacterized protein n=1 Tax=Salinomyces thailandicus TaxID=706561 RepID=A0A4U0UAR2_9PEZI|nr:hypothetical protein B0A50_01494 [Salinomyces thailandica]
MHYLIRPLHGLAFLLALFLDSLRASASNATTCPEACGSRIFQYGDPTYSIENLAIRSNGAILFTPPFPAAALYQVSPTTGNSSFETVANNVQLGNASFALGITELYPDVFAVITGTLNQTGTFKIHTVDFNVQTEGGSKGPQVKLTNEVPEARLLNGLAAVDQESGVLLASESYLGEVLRIDTVNGKHSVVARGATYEALPGATEAAASIGINGIRKLGGSLYFLNSSKKFFGKLGVDAKGYAVGVPEVVANLTAVQALPDDVALAEDGKAFIAGSDKIVEVSSQGKVSVLIGGEGVATVAGDTSAQLGKGAKSSTLYVTSGIAPLNGVDQVPGFIESLDLDCVAACRTY